MQEVVETAPVITVEWEDGKFMSYPIVVADHTAAYAKLDEIMRDAEWPSSIAIVLKDNGVAFWGQHGTTVWNVGRSLDVEL